MMKYLFIITLLIGGQLHVQAQELKVVNYHDENQKLSGLVTSNADQKLPGVLILPA